MDTSWQKQESIWVMSLVVGLCTDSCQEQATFLKSVRAWGWSIVPRCEMPCNDTISSAVGRGIVTSSLETPFPVSKTGHYRFHWTECTHCPLWINMLIEVKLQNNFLLMYWLCAKYDICCCLEITLLLFHLTSPTDPGWRWLGDACAVWSTSCSSLT